MKRLSNLALGLGASLLLAGTAQGAQEIELHEVSTDGVGESIGTVTVEDTDYGLLLTPDLSGLNAGMHGFHVHQNASCEPKEEGGETTPAGAAGGHLDPQDTGTHQGPYGEGHLGDLPVLMVDEEGNATTPVLAPRLEVADLEGRALMIHEGGDTYSDEPKLGGGAGRVACGAVGQ
ncbi:superoxide dismutase, Cu-Zn family [Modicisalibacter muralis]|uniref:Superoxide dismutase, Cu-Zn family n=1 Tax=Modicisalibacter muralis TaxID=119000 RepID=A0A1G9KBY2_9GAMM|nr:superoxide dismutase family protein [Halomonas muralis]SDL47132.1 superoxide dismutase, Cu-Zn family [Halomonas muralis]